MAVVVRGLGGGRGGGLIKIDLDGGVFGAEAGLEAVGDEEESVGGR